MIGVADLLFCDLGRVDYLRHGTLPAQILKANNMFIILEPRRKVPCRRQITILSLYHKSQITINDRVINCLTNVPCRHLPETVPCGLYPSPVPRWILNWFHVGLEFTISGIICNYKYMKVCSKVLRLTKILSQNVTRWGLLFNIVTQAVHILLPSMLLCLDPHW